MHLHFMCNDCRWKQKLYGHVYIAADKENITNPDRILYEMEVRCKSCESSSLELQSLEYQMLVLRKALLNVDNISIGKDAIEEKDNLMLFSKLKAYLKNRNGKKRRKDSEGVTERL